MLGFRPKTSNHYLSRSRLLRLLPEEPGFVVWLEAPYGYGKSVLSSQWADRLEAGGWRVVWLALAEREPKEALARHLSLPPEAPWAVVLEALWQQPTLLVLEDLETLRDEILHSHAGLSPLLKDVRGLVLLASRNRLTLAELPRLVTERRLLHLGADALAFSAEETRLLFQDRERADQTWQRTQGWPLPLHFASLTGELPERDALLEGMRGSLKTPVWEEALLLAAVSHLPEEAARATTERLARSGFAQRIEVGYRLHALAGEAILQAYAEAVQRVVLREAPRLPPLLRGEAFERAGLYEALGALLDTPRGSLARQAPEAVLRWDALAPEPSGAERRRSVGWSFCSLGDFKRGVPTLLQAAELPGASADERLNGYRDAVWFLAQTQDFERARSVEAAAETLFEQSSPETVGAYLNNLFLLHFEKGDWQEAAATLRTALEYYPATSSKRAISEGNLAIVKWHHRGDVDALRLGRSRALASNKKHNPSNVPGDLLQLGEVAHLLGERDEALAYCREAKSYAKASPRWALETEALGAYLELDATPFSLLFAKAEAWQDESLLDRIRFFWANTLLNRSEPREALRVLGDATGFWSRVARALALGSAEREQALAALGAEPSPERYMENRLYWHAARYRVTRAAEDLEKLLELTLVRERMLPGLVPLLELPRERPDLARVYPLAEVLKVGWREAVEARHDDLPDLELRLFAETSATLLSEPLDLTDRQKQMLVLLTLGLGRDEVAEAMWPEVDPKKQRNNLNVQLNMLRKVIEPWGVSTYLFEDGLRRVVSDYAKLNAALESGDAGAAHALYREPFAPGIDLFVVEEERGRLREGVVTLLFEASASAPSPDAAAYLERVLELEPLHEEALQNLLKQLVKRGRRREARGRFYKFEELLKEEMGLEPLKETRAILN